MAELSAYEAKRQQRIEENRAALLALQIDRLPAPKRQRRDAPSKPAQPVARRRSARLQELKTLTPEAIERARRLEKRERLVEGEIPLPTVSRSRKVRPATLLDLPVLDVRLNEHVGRRGPVVSIRELDVEVEHFHDLWLGKQILPFGKNPVMQGIVSASVATGTAPIAVFSQMSGLQPFRNAIALFVNVDQSTSYDNVFQEADADSVRVVYFRWFAQMLSTLQTSAIQRLLRVRRGDARFFLEESEENDKVESGGDTTDDVKDEQEHEKPKEEPLLLFLRQTLVSGECFL
jgi:hypothetical protein